MSGRRAARVLVVDDASDLRLLMTAVLRRAGHEVFEANSGEQALAWLADQGPQGWADVIVLDVQMPEVDGWEVLRRLRADPAVYGRAAVLVCTVKSSASDRQRARELDASDYLAKPFAISELTDRVATLAQRSVETHPG